MMKNSLLIALLSIGSVSFSQTEIYNEDFQSGLPVSYTLVDNDGFTPNAAAAEYTEAWILTSDPDNPSDSVMGSTSYFDPIGLADRWLITPGITLGGYGNTVKWEGKSFDPSHPDSYFVLVSGTDTQLSSFTDTLDIVYNELADTWTEHEGDLSELGFDNQTVHIAFVNRTYDGFKLFIDSIRVEIEDPASVNILEKNHIAVYPNPAQNSIHIANVENFENLKIISPDGRIVMESISESVDIQHLIPGKYFIVALGNSNIYRTSFIKL